MNRVKKVLLGATSLALVPIAAVTAWSDESDAASACPTFGEVHRTGVTQGEMGLREASGIIASAQNPGVFWTHNDNGGQNRVFALDASGRVLASFWLSETRTGSIEDIAFGVGPDGRDWIYVGDFGDNKRTRAKIAFHRFPEPDVDVNWRTQDEYVSKDQIETIQVQYRTPGTTDRTWSRDAEAMAIDPVTGDMFVFEKQLMHVGGLTQASYVYRVPAADLAEGEVRIAEPVSLIRARTVDSGAGLTAADISRDGSMVIAKNMREVFVWPRQPGESVAEVLEASPEAPCRAPAEIGEAIAVTPDGSSLVMVREGLKTPIWWVPVLEGVVIRDTVIDNDDLKDPPAPDIEIGGAGDNDEQPTTTVPPTSTEPPATTAPTTTAPTTTVPTTTAPTTTVPPLDPEPPLEPEPRTTVPLVDQPVDDDDSESGSGIGIDVEGGGITLAGPTCNGLPATIVGTSGDDVLEGTAGDDVIAAGPGNDVVNGRGGNDVICGHEGHDEIRGSVGNDVLFGGDGDDRIFGGSGNDLIRGYDGDDKMFGGPGDDVLAGNRGSDVLVGSEDTDRLIARDPGDTCYEGTHSQGPSDCVALL